MKHCYHLLSGVTLQKNVLQLLNSNLKLWRKMVTIFLLIPAETNNKQRLLHSMCHSIEAGAQRAIECWYSGWISHRTALERQQGHRDAEAPAWDEKERQRRYSQPLDVLLIQPEATFHCYGSSHSESTFGESFNLLNCGCFPPKTSLMQTYQCGKYLHSWCRSIRFEYQKTRQSLYIIKQFSYSISIVSCVSVDRRRPCCTDWMEYLVMRFLHRRLL